MESSWLMDDLLDDWLGDWELMEDLLGKRGSVWLAIRSGIVVWGSVVGTGFVVGTSVVGTSVVRTGSVVGAGSVVGTNLWLAIRQLVGTGLRLDTVAIVRVTVGPATVGSATVGSSSDLSLGCDAIARPAVTSIPVTVSVAWLGTVTTESTGSSAVNGAASPAVTEAEPAVGGGEGVRITVFKIFGKNSFVSLASRFGMSFLSVSDAEIRIFKFQAGTSNFAAFTITVAESGSVSVAEVISTAKSFAQ